MKARKVITLVIIFCLGLTFLTISAYSEPQDMVDSQGNKYKMDKDGTMYTYGDPNAVRQPVSIENLPYYYNETLNLIAKKHNFEAVIMGSEILDLPETSVGIRVSKWSIGKVLAPIISESKLNEKIVVVKHREGDNIIYRNRLYSFEIKYPLYFKPFAELAGVKENSMANVGFVLTNPDKQEAPVNVALFAKVLKENISLDDFARQWSLDEKYPGLKSSDISTPLGKDSKGYMIEWLENGKMPFAGEQIFKIQDGIGYYIIFSCSKDKYDAFHSAFKEFVSNIKITKLPPLQYISDDDKEVKEYLQKKTK